MVTTARDTAPIVQNTPQCLRSRRQWVCWRYDTSDSGKPTKVPYDPRSGRRASSTDPATWITFEEALDAYTATESYNGVGYVFSGSDGMAGIDLDDCIRSDGSLAPWAQEVVDQFQTYSEISPSETGLKVFLRGRKPDHAGCKVGNLDGGGELEMYDRNRYFTITGNRWPGSPADVADRQTELDALCNRFWGQKEPRPTPQIAESPGSDRAADCLSAMLAIRMIDKGDGSMRLYTAACRCVEHDLTDAEAVATIHAYAQMRPFPTHWTDEQIIQRVRDAEAKCRRGAALTADTDCKPAFKSVGQLLTDYPELRPPIIHGLLRQGETMNIIAPPKTGKSWAVTDLALSVATGHPWLGKFPTTKGQVLILDNELHGETSAHRIPKVAEARGINLATIADMVYVENLRGSLRDLVSLGPYFKAIEPGRFNVIILDAFYRFLPRDTDENDNGSVAQLYNYLDRYAQALGCCFILIHHSTKGSQSGKAVTDVGAGAGSQSRATDSHLILRQHEQDGAVVLDAAVRSWKPVDPICLRWAFPVWVPDDSLDPLALRPERPRRPRPPKDAEVVETPTAPKWDVERFVNAFITREGKQTETIVGMAVDAGLSQNRARRLLAQAQDDGKVHRWTGAANRPVRYSTEQQPLIETSASSQN